MPAPLTLAGVALLDALLVVVFATLGRGVHAEGLGAGQVWSTAWPFLVGLAVGWGALLVARWSPTSVRSGVVLWATTLAVGMLLRGLGDGRVPHWSFMIVAALTTALLLIGWRGALAAVRRVRS